VTRRRDPGLSARLPLDPDLDAAEDNDVFGTPQRGRLPRIHWRSVVAVFLGGFFGGLARYGIGLAWPTPAGGFPADIFVINTAGCFALALLLVVVSQVLPPTTYLRPALGTGFCGAFTTFSSLAVADDLLLAHSHAGTAISYLVLSLAAGLGATLFGILAGRAIPAYRRTSPEEA
jgi:CrcB protein